MPKSSKVRVGTLVALLVIAVAGGFFLRESRDSGKATFCKTSLPIEQIDGKTVAVQVRHPGSGFCTVPKTNLGQDTLDLDCKLRAPDGEVVATVKPSGNHNTC